MLTKAAVADANTSYAQGGIAAAVGETDSWQLHEQDTLVAGAGLCDPEAVRFLVQNAPQAIRWLESLGAQFDKASDGDLSLGREGGHSMNRIVRHADRTGWEVERVVVDAVRSNPRITVIEHAFATHLLLEGGHCTGVSVRIDRNMPLDFRAPSVMLATGGCGRLYRHTTNPDVATADGIALAARAGAVISDMEFMQFHPTTLYHPQMRSFLITEAVRGAGGTLRNHLGSRFMYDYDERLELAPRDIVSRSIVAEMKKLATWCVYLDMTHLPPDEILREFPTISEKLGSIGLPAYREWIPVVPAQHYSCGGINTCLRGRTNIRGLYAAGEVARTGVHGANRLASNSLLEALTFASAAAEDSWPVAAGSREVEGGHAWIPAQKSIPENDSIRIRRRLQSLMTDHVGIVRTNSGLQEAVGLIDELIDEFDRTPSAPFSPHPMQTLNLLIAARYVARGALERKENVGLHFNEDIVNV